MLLKGGPLTDPIATRQEEPKRTQGPYKKIDAMTRTALLSYVSCAHLVHLGVNARPALTRGRRNSGFASTPRLCLEPLLRGNGGGGTGLNPPPPPPPPPMLPPSLSRCK